MNELYNSKETKRLLTSVLPGKFKICNDETSNGFVFFNTLYGIENDKINDYLDQASHYTSLENFNYGLDADMGTLTVPEVITSGYITGDDVPIKITTYDEFQNGYATRIEPNESGDIDLSGKLTGVSGLEYMRTDKFGNGKIVVNSVIKTDYAYINNQSQSYELNISDLLVPDVDNISGFNRNFKMQNFDNIGRYELVSPLTEDVMSTKYSKTKTIQAPGDGIGTQPLKPFTVDYYIPEPTYYWCSTDRTYKPELPLTNYYFDSDNKKVYYRQYLNNPSGSGVFDTEYLTLEHTPINGSLKVYDVDNLTDGTATEIPIGGLQSYTCNVYASEEDKTEGFVHYKYIGYSNTLDSNIIHDDVENYKLTTYDYVYEGDKLENFIYVQDTDSPITNKIKIVNSISRYYVEYVYSEDEYVGAITSTKANRYIKKYDKEYLISSTDKQNNLYEINGELSKDPGERKAITFHGLDVRPGSIIDKTILDIDIEKEIELESFNSTINMNELDTVGAYKDVLPKLILPNYDIMNINHNTDFLSGRPTVFLDSILSKHITNTINISSFSTIYDVVRDIVFRAKFKINLTKSNINIIKSSNSNNSYQLSCKHTSDNTSLVFIFTDTTGQFISLPVECTTGVIDIILLSKTPSNVSLTGDNDQRIELFVKSDDGFFKQMTFRENSNQKITNVDVEDKTELFDDNSDVFLSFVNMYRRS
jgi:hypothetical protein